MKRLGKVTREQLTAGRLSEEQLRERQLVIEAFEEHLDAAGAGNQLLGYMARVLLLCTLPHRRPESGSYERRNGGLVLSMVNHPSIGLPYGRYPRLLLCWATTEIVRTRSPVLELGSSLNRFLGELGLTSLSGGPRGTRSAVVEQIRRLFTTTIAVSFDGNRAWHDQGFRIAERLSLWQDPVTADGPALGSVVRLSRAFFESIIDRPVPVDVGVLRALRSPLAIDLYCWLTYRQSYLRRPTTVPWELLRAQFGQGYARRVDFRRKLLIQLREVEKHFPTGASESDAGLVLRPRATHVPKRLEAGSGA